MKVIHTDRLVFRQYVKCSADRDALTSLFTDAESMKYVEGGAIQSEDKAEEAFKRMFTTVYEISAFDIWCIFAKGTSEYVGHAELKPYKGTEDWEIIYILKQEHRGKGYSSEIAQALVKYGFAEKMLSRIVATVDAENVNAIRALKNIGMTSSSTSEDEQKTFQTFAINRPE